MPYPSVVDIIDTLSPVVTLGFGIFCAVNDTKPKDGKLSRAGKIALWGLIISGVITLVVKGNSLRVKLKEEEAKVVAQEKQRIEKEHADSVNAAFEKATSDRLVKSVTELDKIKSASRNTLQSLTEVSAKQQAALENTRRGLNPLFPLRISITFTIDIGAFNKKYRSHYMPEINRYLDTLSYYATKAKIPAIMAIHNHSGNVLDTINIPRATVVDPLQINKSLDLPKPVVDRFAYAKQTFAGLFLIKSFSINLRKQVPPTSQLALNFNLWNLIEKILKYEATDEEIKNITTEIDRKTGLLTIIMLTDNPEIESSGMGNHFISLYDLQNSFIGIKQANSNVNDVEVCKSIRLSIFTGYKFSRSTTFTFTDDNKATCCNELFTRQIKVSEIE